MSNIPQVPKLPTYGMQDGDQILDAQGNIFEFDAEQGSWIYRGEIQPQSLVSINNDGLIYPEIYRKLQLLQEMIDRGIDFNIFKLDTPGNIPYYYLFNSSDDLIRFYPESRNKLRVELDRSRLYHKFLRTCCIGPQGAIGDQGAAGRDGLPAANETFKSPSNVTQNSIKFSTTVSTPIDTEISLRLFRGETDDVLVEYLVDISGATGKVIVGGKDGNLTEDQLRAADLLREARGKYQEGYTDDALEKLNEILGLGVDQEATQEIIDSINNGEGFPDSAMPLTIIIYDDDIDIVITDTVIEFDLDTNTLSGTLTFSSGTSDISLWKYKARQRGPKGKSGSDGSPFLVVEEQTLDDPLIRSSTAIISARRSGLTNNIFYVSNDLTTETCVSNLGITAATLPTGDLLQAKFAAVKTTTRRCKDVGFYQYDKPEYEAPPLELPSWDPTPDCVSSARYNQYKYEWWDIAEPKYPWRIFRPTRPNEQCNCQEDLFWCPNVGDNPCVAEGSMIHTDKGLTPIEQLEVGSKVMCPDGEFRPIDEFYDNGIRDCIKITFSDGSEIVCTPDHRFPVGGQQIEAKDLKPFDQIHKVHGSLEWMKKNRKGTKYQFNRGYMIGYLLGDGWISDKSIGIVAPEYEEEGFRKAYEILVQKLGENKISKRRTENGIVMLIAEWKSKEARHLFSDLGWYKNLQHPDGPKMEIPDSIYRESLEFYKGFFSALINSDGCINRNSEINIVSSCLETLPKICHRILGYLGISSNFKHYTGANGDIYRTDIHSKFNKIIKEELSEGLMESKICNLTNLPHNEQISWIQPELHYDITKTDEYRSGLIAGAFIYSGGYNKQTQRAWIKQTMPVDLRNELNLDLPTKGKHYIWNAEAIVGKHVDGDLICRDYAIGFLRSSIYHRERLSPDKSFKISRIDVDEFDFTCKCLDMLEIKYKTNNKQQYEIILYGHNVYKLLMFTGFRERIGDLQPRLPIAGNGVVNIKSIQKAGNKHVYDYKVLPDYMMAVEGIYALDCGVNTWKCGGIEKLPSGAADAQGLSCDGSVREPILKAPKPLQPECDCDCISPISYELQNGGYSLNPITLSNSDTQSVAEFSVIDGRTDTYKINIKASQYFKVNISLAWNSDVCGGDIVEQENCQYIEECEVHSTVIFEDNEGNAVISGGGMAELSEVPADTSFVINSAFGTDIDVLLNVMINDTRSQCCRGYTIRITATTDVDDSDILKPL